MHGRSRWVPRCAARHGPRVEPRQGPEPAPTATPDGQAAVTVANAPKAPRAARSRRTPAAGRPSATGWVDVREPYHPLGVRPRSATVADPTWFFLGTRSDRVPDCPTSPRSWARCATGAAQAPVRSPLPARSGYQPVNVTAPMSARTIAATPNRCGRLVIPPFSWPQTPSTTLP